MISVGLVPARAKACLSGFNTVIGLECPMQAGKGMHGEVDH